MVKFNQLVRRTKEAVSFDAVHLETCPARGNRAMWHREQPAAFNRGHGRATPIGTRDSKGRGGTAYETVIPTRLFPGRGSLNAPNFRRPRGRIEGNSARSHIGEANSRLPTFVLLALAGNFAPLLLLWFVAAVHAVGAGRVVSVVALIVGLADMLAPTLQDAPARLSW